MSRKTLVFVTGLLVSLLVEPTLTAGTASRLSPRDVSIVGGQWTWAGGSEHVAVWERYGSYGTKGVAAPGNRPGVRYGSISWTDGSGNLWLFGGAGYAAGYSASVPDLFFLNDLWKWDGTNWTWASGSDAGGQHGTYGTKGVAAPGNVPGARFYSVSGKDASGNLWLFGGAGGSANDGGWWLNDLWKWDGTTWTWVSGSNAGNQHGTYGTKGVAAPGNVPGARCESVSWTDANGNFWVFGGSGYAASSFGELNDLWKWDGTNWTWVSGADSAGQPGTYGTRGVAAPGNMPGARRDAVSWTDASGNLWLFGGSNANLDRLNDLWKWDGVTWTWMSGSNVENQYGIYGTKGVAAPGNVPGARTDSVSWTDASGNLWVFGGSGYAASSYGELNDLWMWDGTNWTWVGGSNSENQRGTYGTKGVAAPGNVPGARHRSVAWRDVVGNLWLFGGSGFAAIRSRDLNDLWKWDGTNWTWVSGSNELSEYGTYGTKGVAAPGNVPGARSGSISRTDANGNFWLFGGAGYSAANDGALNDLWKWDGMSWTWVSGSDVADQPGSYGTRGVAAPGNVPGARYGSVSWIGTSGNLWLFGGEELCRGWCEGENTSRNDLWKWDGTNWTWMSGSSNLGSLGTYGAKGIAAPGNTPGARSWSVSWTDESGDFWLFGGWGNAATEGGLLNDLWKWDGTSWTWMGGSNLPDQPGTYGTKLVGEPGNIPGGRGEAVSWRDPSGDTWIFGGRGYVTAFGGFLNDLWKWDGTSWTWMSGSNGTDQPGVYGTKGFSEPGNVPGGRAGSVAWTDSSGKLWLLGGYENFSVALGNLNDLWTWNGTAWTWVSGSNAPAASGTYGTRGVSAASNVPGARDRAASWTDAGGNLWLFGGGGRDATGLIGSLNDLWVFGAECVAIAPPAAGNGGPYGPGATISLTVSTIAGATYFWSGPNGFTSTEQNPTIPGATTAMTGTYSITATVGACASSSSTDVVVIGPESLTVTKTGAGSGSVTSNASGIDCGSTCSASFPGMSSVTLTATADAGSRFAGWSGAGCQGTDPCIVTMSGAKSVSATFLPAGGVGFHTLTPCRIVDTRDANGGPALSAGAARAFAIAGQCVVPADASAVALNVTVTNPTSAGSLTVYPGTGAVPGTSTVSFAAGRTRANNVTIGLIGGLLSILDQQETGTTDVIIDVSGYYR